MPSSLGMTSPTAETLEECHQVWHVIKYWQSSCTVTLCYSLWGCCYV